MEARGCGSVSQSPEHFRPARRVPRHILERSNRRHRNGTEPGRKRKHGFTKMAEEHEQIAQMIERRRHQAQAK
jgi:hypothetical protein